MTGRHGGLPAAFTNLRSPVQITRHYAPVEDEEYSGNRSLMSPGNLASGTEDTGAKCANARETQLKEDVKFIVDSFEQCIHKETVDEKPGRRENERRIKEMNKLQPKAESTARLLNQYTLETSLYDLIKKARTSKSKRSSGAFETGQTQAIPSAKKLKNENANTQRRKCRAAIPTRTHTKPKIQKSVIAETNSAKIPKHNKIK
ncbi:hypothetical protein H6P81_016755 [Aristolochia fimbriata]|uniref:Uncharacterized protein n=1 Tax=Aristolochia fimbriata TaxID=158543 RepID=A0AAV7E976_ARIFI|nr:hypothetical protein H6P81_016755 [Aristolochia fimbriata]